MWSVKCGVWSFSLECEERSVKCEVWGLECEGSSEKCEVWSVECEVWSVKFQFGVRRAQCEVWSVRFGVWRKQWEVRSVKCGVWSVECEVSVWSAKRAVWSVKCEVWSVKEAVRSEKCEVWSVECEVWSLECEECSVKCGVWSVKTLLRLSLKKSNGCRGKDTVGTGCLWTIGHLCLGNFRRRLARVYVMIYAWVTDKITYYSQWTWPESRVVVPYRLWRFSYTFEHPKSTPCSSFPLILSATHMCCVHARMEKSWLSHTQPQMLSPTWSPYADTRAHHLNLEKRWT